MKFSVLIYKPTGDVCGSKPAPFDWRKGFSPNVWERFEQIETTDLQPEDEDRSILVGKRLVMASKISTKLINNYEEKLELEYFKKRLEEKGFDVALREAIL